MTFDCYGTLIDWESGIIATVRPWLEAAGRAEIPDDLVLSAFALHQARHQQTRPALLYTEVMARTWADIQASFGLPEDAEQCAAFARSCGDWPPFPDTVSALRRLSTRFALAILSNVDEASLARSLVRLEVPFLLTVTAERVGSYKPGLPHFETAFEDLAARGYDRGSILHVAQSRHHDVEPAAKLGLPVVWVNRRYGQRGTGATIANAAVPTARVQSLAALADALAV
nr:HAD-IA family hydrolase [Neoroseomonas alba]